MSRTPVLEMRSIAKTFGNFHALKGVDLTVFPVLDFFVLVFLILMLHDIDCSAQDPQGGLFLERMVDRGFVGLAITCQVPQLVAFLPRDHFQPLVGLQIERHGSAKLHHHRLLGATRRTAKNQQT